MDDDGERKKFRPFKRIRKMFRDTRKEGKKSNKPRKNNEENLEAFSDDEASLRQKQGESVLEQKRSKSHESLVSADEKSEYRPSKSPGGSKILQLQNQLNLQMKQRSSMMGFSPSPAVRHSCTTPITTGSNDGGGQESPILSLKERQERISVIGMLSAERMRTSKLPPLGVKEPSSGEDNKGVDAECDHNQSVTNDDASVEMIPSYDRAQTVSSEDTAATNEAEPARNVAAYSKLAARPRNVRPRRLKKSTNEQASLDPTKFAEDFFAVPCSVKAVVVKPDIEPSTDSNVAGMSLTIPTVSADAEMKRRSAIVQSNGGELKIPLRKTNSMKTKFDRNDSAPSLSELKAAVGPSSVEDSSPAEADCSADAERESEKPNADAGVETSDVGLDSTAQSDARSSHDDLAQVSVARQRLGSEEAEMTPPSPTVDLLSEIDGEIGKKSSSRDHLPVETARQPETEASAVADEQENTDQGDCAKTTAGAVAESKECGTVISPQEKCKPAKSVPCPDPAQSKTGDALRSPAENADFRAVKLRKLSTLSGDERPASTDVLRLVSHNFADRKLRPISAIPSTKSPDKSSEIPVIQLRPVPSDSAKTANNTNANNNNDNTMTTGKHVFDYHKLVQSKNRDQQRNGVSVKKCSSASADRNSRSEHELLRNADQPAQKLRSSTSRQTAKSESEKVAGSDTASEHFRASALPPVKVEESFALRPSFTKAKSVEVSEVCIGDNQAEGKREDAVSKPPWGSRPRRAATLKSRPTAITAAAGNKRLSADERLLLSQSSSSAPSAPSWLAIALKKQKGWADSDGKMV